MKLHQKMPKPQRKKIVLDPLRDYSEEQLDRLYYVEALTPEALKRLPYAQRHKYSYLLD